MKQSGESRVATKMLELWRPPAGAGDATGCLTSTFTFAPGLFDEQCLARFLQIDSEPNRENLAFLLEREQRLGEVYAGVLVDHTQSGVDHSLRWDVLPVRIRGGKQHAKLSILGWTNHVRVIVTSANLSEQGYRSNFEVADSIEFCTDSADHRLAADVITFMRGLTKFVPGGVESSPAVRRALGFLLEIEKQVRVWKPSKGDGMVRRYLPCTLPANANGTESRSTLEEAIRACRSRGGSPNAARVASPFFDVGSDSNLAAAALCKSLGKAVNRMVTYCVPMLHDKDAAARPRLMAPRSLLTSSKKYNAEVKVRALPEMDFDRNRRSWHAKMIGFEGEKYVALMIGSSNFTSAGLGLLNNRNAEANLLTVVDHASYAQEAGQLDGVWPKTKPISNSETAEWLGASLDADEEESAQQAVLPPGFLSATYRAGDVRQVILHLDVERLPAEWVVSAAADAGFVELESSVSWSTKGQPTAICVDWSQAAPPSKLCVRWDKSEAFIPLNVEDGRALPPPAILGRMSADEMLVILAAADPGAALRVWSSLYEKNSEFDDELDSATPLDLDPLRRHDIRETFLHRIRKRARVFANLRANLERPLWGRQQLEWRLSGLIGIRPLAERYVAELEQQMTDKSESLLALSDLLIVIQSVTYVAEKPSMESEEFQDIYRPFLSGLARDLNERIARHPEQFDRDAFLFWTRVIKKCRD